MIKGTNSGVKLYNMPINQEQIFKSIDAHHHIWKVSDLTWLNGATQPRIFGDYTAIKRDYPMHNFITDVTSEGIIGSVYIQVNWPSGKEIDEATWVQDQATRLNWPLAIIGYADFGSDDCRKTLKGLSQLSLVKGIRQQLHWHKNPLYKFATEPDIMMNAKWQYNFAILQDYNWLFELQVFASQMDNAAKLAKKFPNIPMVLQHCGMPEDSSTSGMDRWLDGMKRLAEQPNIHCKFSGLGTFIHENSEDFISDITGQCLDLFKSNRCIYGSNFPIEKIWTSYTDLFQGYRKALRKLTQGCQNAIFYDNANKLYRIF